MAKALKTIGMIAGAVALVATGVGAFAGGAIIGTTVGAAGATAVTLGSVAGTIATYAGSPADRDQVGFRKWEDEVTLQNGFVCGSRVNLYCDTAWLKMPEATVGLFYPKSVAGSAFPYAVTMTFLGHPEPDRLESHLALASPANPADLIEALRGSLADYGQRYPDSVARFLAGSWDAKHARARMHIVATDDLGFTPPLEPVELTAYVSSGNQSAAYRLANELGWTQARMLNVIDAQRAEPFASPIHPAVYAVGGSAVELTVSRKGVRSQVVRHWNDEVGKPIAPKEIA